MKLLKNMKIILSGHEAKEKSPEDIAFVLGTLFQNFLEESRDLDQVLIKLKEELKYKKIRTIKESVSQLSEKDKMGLEFKHCLTFILIVVQKTKNMMQEAEELIKKMVKLINLRGENKK